ncbi:MAG TPA: phosphotransferase [Planctomycetota bacterium]|jgi:aminoglycoside phosphotransferase (APT) family kinase protein|nr:phosphotransferase [Planctomycetota bacterium]
MKVLSGGVSGDVVLTDEGHVRKQFLPRLKVAMEWTSDPRRVFREIESLRAWSRIVGPESVPRVLSVEPEAFAYTMEYAEGPSWKDLLMAGDVRRSIAHELGRRLALVHRRPDEEARRALAGPGYFYELRVEPYYETVRRVHPDLPIRADFRSETLVHGDYSPKNVLVHAGGLWVLDHEVAHWGDPAFDLAFMLNHLLIKSFVFADARYRDAARAFVDAYGPGPELEARTMAHVAVLMLARVDGKSPLAYLDEDQRRRLRALARRRILEPVERLERYF